MHGQQHIKIRQGKSAEFRLFTSAEMSDGQANNCHVSYSASYQ